MTVWIDADSCPVLIRPVIIKACDKYGIPARFVACRNIPLPPGRYAELVVTEKEDQAADELILDHAVSGDLVITRDTILAERILGKNIDVINDRGDVFTDNMIRERVSMGKAMKELRLSGLAGSGGNSYGKKEVHAFSSAFDRVFHRLLKKRDSI